MHWMYHLSSCLVSFLSLYYQGIPKLQVSGIKMGSRPKTKTIVSDGSTYLQ